MTRGVVRVLDRYVAGEFLKIFAITVIGFPLVTIMFNLTDNIDRYLSSHVTWKNIALAYLYYFPEQIFLITPAAVLFATVFSVGAFSRHSEITAAKASGISFHRMVAPAFALALLASVLTFFLGEAAPLANEHRAELLGERELRSTSARYNFVYRADGGRVYAVRSLNVPRHEMLDVQIEREGTGPDFPGYFLTASRADWKPASGWTMSAGTMRLFLGPDREVAFSFDSLRQKAMTERPQDLLIEPKAPEQMRYAELSRYVETLERSGSDANKLQVERALKVAIPLTCLIIALFGAPLGLSGARSGATYGIALSLATTIVFLVMIQISKAVGAGGVIPPLLAAWLPNGIFGTAGLVLFARART
ncbi:MAG: LptF/LptG family permease [Gemmatimonadales bacterium]|nr:LptF/LptG family permease [Gemmatimonadales bacterium]